MENMRIKSVCVLLPVGRLFPAHCIVELLPTRVTVKGEVVLFVTVASVGGEEGVFDRTHLIDAVLVPDALEEVQAVTVQEEGCGNRVDRRIAPSFVEEAARLVQVLKVVFVGL